MPLAVGTAADLQHADPVGSLLLAHLIDGALAAAIGQVGIAEAVSMQGRVDVLVVDHQQAMVIGCLLEGEEVHAVVVVTGLQQLCLPVLGGVLAPGRGIVQYRIAPAEERLGAVTLGHQHPVEVGRGLRRYSAETQQWPGRWRAAALAAEQAGAEQADGCQRQTAFEHLTAAAVNDAVQVGGLAGVEAAVVQRLEVGVVMVVFLSHAAVLIECGSGRCCGCRARPPAGR